MVTLGVEAEDLAQGTWAYCPRTRSGQPRCGSPWPFLPRHLPPSSSGTTVTGTRISSPVAAASGPSVTAAAVAATMTDPMQLAHVDCVSDTTRELNHELLSKLLSDWAVS